MWPDPAAMDRYRGPTKSPRPETRKGAESRALSTCTQTAATRGRPQRLVEADDLLEELARREHETARAERRPREPRVGERLGRAGPLAEQPLPLAHQSQMNH